ncbi:MAG TPA: hypothetical protein VF595_04580 [Tepidisphaeraceae bacterium]|jgi:hypothetical protein
MSDGDLRQHAKALIDDLSPPQLRVASAFLAFVKSRTSDAATLELLSIPGFEASFARGEKDIKAGRTRPWRKVRADV